jgi:hypothetical protein
LSLPKRKPSKDTSSDRTINRNEDTSSDPTLQDSSISRCQKWVRELISDSVPPLGLSKMSMSGEDFVVSLGLGTRSELVDDDAMEISGSADITWKTVFAQIQQSTTERSQIHYSQ